MVRILLATDFSKASENAYRYCISLAGRVRMEVLVAHVYRHGAHAHLSERHLELFYQQEYQEFLSRARQFSQLYPNLTDPQIVLRSAVEVEVTEGETSASLIGLCQSHRIDIIAIGSKEKPGIFRRVFGHLSRDLLRKTSSPVLVVPEIYSGQEPQQIAILSVTPADEMAIDTWVDVFEPLSSTRRMHLLVNSDSSSVPKAAPGRQDDYILIGSDDFPDILQALTVQEPDMVLVTVRTGDQARDAAYRNRLIRYLYDELKVPLLCLHD